MGIRKLFFVISVILLSYNSVSYCQERNNDPLKFSAGLITGYNRGYGIQANLMISDFSIEFPFDLRFGVGYTLLNPGNSADARRIFVNNATNGVPEKKGRSFDYRIDFLSPQSFFGVNHSYLAFGPRFSTFRGEFVYVGGNEDFEVISHQWGIGAGIENHFKLIRNLEFVFVIGLDYYFPATLSGHDTSYSPDNDNVNPRNDNQNGDLPFSYKDANKAINQPVFMPRVMIGVNLDL